MTPPSRLLACTLVWLVLPAAPALVAQAPSLGGPGGSAVGASFAGLGHLPGGALTSWARDVSADGLVVVGGDASGFGTPFRWTARDGMTSLGDVPGGAFYAIAWGISADGTRIVGEARLEPTSPGGDEAYLWFQGGGFVFLDPERGATIRSSAQAISDNGAVVVGSTSNGAMVWDAAHGMRTLADVLVVDHGLDLAGWMLIQANAVSADGTVVVGYGLNPQGDTEAWIASLPPAPVAVYPGKRP